MGKKETPGQKIFDNLPISERFQLFNVDNYVPSCRRKF